MSPKPCRPRFDRHSPPREREREILGCLCVLKDGVPGGDAARGPQPSPAQAAAPGAGRWPRGPTGSDGIVCATSCECDHCNNAGAFFRPYSFVTVCARGGAICLSSHQGR